MKILSRLQEKNIIFSAFMAVALSFFLAHRMFVKTPGRLEDWASSCIFPLLSLQKKIIAPIESHVLQRKTMDDLQKKVAILEDEKQELKARVAELESLQFFTEQTEEVRQFTDRYETHHMQLAHIIMSRFTPTEQVFFVDRGEHHGIVKDMVAIYKKSIIGKVDHVYPYYSKIISTADKRCKIAAYCSKTKTQGIFEGDNNLETATLAHVDRLKKLKKEENVISSGEGTVFPQGFLLGTIESFEPQGMHHAVKIKPAFDVQTLNYCYLMQKGQESLLS